MKKIIFRKILLIGIIVLFIGISVVPSISSLKENNIDNTRGKDQEIMSLLSITSKDVKTNEGNSDDISYVFYPIISYVIITTNDFIDEFQRLAYWKETRASYTPYNNIRTKIVLVENITSNRSFWYDGYWGDGGDENIFNDTQCQIRNFIKMAHTRWNTEYVLLAGDGDDDGPIIPARYCGDIPCDMYYGCLDGNWDNDSDGIFGEKSWIDGGGGMDGEEADFFAEVYIGRAPVDSIEEADNFVSKTIAYENATDDEYLKKAMMIEGSHYPGPSTDIVTEIIPQYTTKKFYHREGTLNKSRILEEMNSNVHIVNYHGHSAQTCFSGIDISDILQLTNTNYFFMFNGGCWSGNFAYDDAISEEFVVSSGGAFAYIGNSVPSHGIPLNSLFFAHLMNQSSTNIGKILSYTKEQYMMECEEDPTSWYRENCFMSILLGDPEIQLKTNIAAPTAHFTTQITEGQRKFPATHTGTIQIDGIARRGNANDTTFEQYIIEYGEGFEPDTWYSNGISLTDDGYSEIDGTLGIWDTSDIDDGPYTLRLTVYDEEGLVGQDWIGFFVANTFSVHNLDKDTYYTTIQDAIDDVSYFYDGDTIYVGNRTYYELITITKSIILIGEDKESTIIDGCGVDDVIFVSANDDVEISGFTIENRNNYDGISVRSGNIIVRDNIIKNNSIGVHLYGGSSEIFHNNFVNNPYHAYNESGNNKWYNETLHAGNYWDDYTDKYPDAVDEEPPYGIWDTPYYIPYGNQDLYPFVNESGWENTILYHFYPI